MIDTDLIRSKLEACALYLRRLEPLAALPFARFSGDPVSGHAAERLVQLVVDEAVDVNNHLLIESGQPAPRDYYSSFTALSKIRVLPSPLARRLAGTAGLRNRLVHAYEEIDAAIFHGALLGFLRVYRQYVRAVRRFMAR